MKPSESLIKSRMVAEIDDIKGALRRHLAAVPGLPISNDPWLALFAWRLYAVVLEEEYGRYLEPRLEIAAALTGLGRRVLLEISQLRCLIETRDDLRFAEDMAAAIKAWEQLEPGLTRACETTAKWVKTTGRTRGPRGPGNSHQRARSVRLATFSMLTMAGIRITNHRTGTVAATLRAVFAFRDEMQGRPPATRAEFNGVQWRKWVEDYNEQAARVLARFQRRIERGKTRRAATPGTES